jgi:hypothetical protein
MPARNGLRRQGRKTASSDPRFPAGSLRYRAATECHRARFHLQRPVRRTVGYHGGFVTPCHYEEKQQMNVSTGKMSRRDAMQRAIGAAAALVLACMSSAGARAAQQKLAKAEVNYVDANTDAGMDCDDCAHFVPGKTAKVAGTCRIVAGAISPHGHCIAFSPRSAK